MAQTTTAPAGEREAPAAALAGTKPPRPAKRVGFYTTLLLLTIVFVLLPFMLSTSFKTNFEAAQPTWIPKDPTAEGYSFIFNADQTPVLRWFANSLLAAGQALLILITASMAAYALARMEFRGKRLLAGLIIATLFVPPIVLLIPNYVIVANLGWLDSLPAVIVPGAAGAFGVFFLRQFFVSLPRELEEAATLDGATPLPDLLQGDPAAVQAGPRHPGPAQLPDQLERLPVAPVRAVQPRATHPPAWPVDPAERLHHRLCDHHGRRGDRQPARPHPVHHRPAVHHRGVSRSGLKG